jgi:predicted MFS family arabinose efflux permease
VVIGLFSGAGSAGQLVFVPSMMALVVVTGWRGAVLLMTASAAALLIPVLFWLRDRPADVGLHPFGQSGEASAAERAEDARTTPLALAARTRDFWLLAGSFFICGYTSNGLIGTHLIPHAVEHGFTEVTAAGTVGLMGAMNIVGTLASGWLTDRYDNRRLLAAYYGFRSLAILALPFIVEVPMLLLFAVVYGLDWIATVPPTANLTATIFGRASLGTVYGWIFFGHMVGAALAAYAGGFFRSVLGDYHMVFLSAAALGFVAVALSLSITPSRARVVEPAPAY